MHLLRSGVTASTFFDLLGRNEDDMTFGLGLVASRSERFLSVLIERMAGSSITPCSDGLIRLQTVDSRQRGRTDVEIELPGRFVGVIEAKRSTSLPTQEQLAKYAPRLSAIDAPVKRLTAVTNAPREHARHSLPSEIDGIPVNHVTWRDIRRMAESARVGESHRNKSLLDEFCGYLGEILGMEKIRSNMVYVVALSRGGEFGLSFIDLVNRHRRYFYRAEGGGWPEPPNYIAYRYDGRLRSIHHVEGYDVFTNPRQVFPEGTDVPVEPHYCLRLGPAFLPTNALRAGPRIQRSMRVWVMLDTLFTSDTLTDALAETRRRLAPNVDSP